jgi:hypothetical protein
VVSLALIGLVILVHHCFVVRKYQVLHEEDFKELDEVSKNTVVKENKTSEIVETE